MKYGKRLISAMLFAAMIFTALPISLVGCGNDEIIYTPETREGYEIEGGEFVTDAKNKNIPSALYKMTVEAFGGDGGKIIPKDAKFTVKTAEKTTAEILSANLSITPYTAFSVSEVSETEFTVTPLEMLDEGRIYRITVGDAENPALSFAFQTEAGMGVASTLPADMAVGVVTNTGIEITFTDTVTKVDFSKYIKITPEVAGKFMLYPDGKTVVFIPDKKLSENTAYEITVKSGIKGDSGRASEADCTFKFRTGESVETAGQNNIFISSDVSEAVFSPDEYPTFYFRLSNIQGMATDVKPVSARLYRFKNAEAARAALLDYEKNKLSENYDPAKGVSDVTEFEIEPVAEQSGSYSATMNFSLPKTKAGVYLLEYTVSVKWNGKTYTKDYMTVMSVSELRLYTESLSGKTLFWVTDRNGNPVSDAELSVFALDRSIHWQITDDEIKNIEKKDGATDSCGVTVIECGGNSAYVTVKHGDSELLACVNINDTAKDGYFLGQIHTDREVYFGNDRVSFSGVITAEGGKKLPSKLYLYVGAVSYGTVNIDSDGGFVGSLPIEDYAGWGLNMRLCTADGNTVLSKYIRVTEEDKPVYRASITFDKLFYEFGDKATATLRATFYDGTPAPGLTFSIGCNAYASLDTMEYVTDENGEAKIKFTPSVIGVNYVGGTYPVNVQLYAELIGFETSRLYIYSSVPYFHSENQIVTERKNGETEVRIYKTDTSRIKALEDITQENILGEPASGKVSVSLMKYTHKKTKTGTSYDPITKTTREQYRYDTVESIEKSYTAEFENGVLRLPHIKVGKDEDVSYSYHVSYYDVNNKTSYRYILWANDDGRADQYYYDYTELALDSVSYRVGETVTAALKRGGKALERTSLFTVYDKNGLVSYTVTDGGHSFEFTDSMILSCRVYGTSYLKENRSFEIRSRNADYDMTAGELDVEIIPDKESYKPGETAKVKIRLRDKNGDPALGRVTLSVVDEACFALGEQYLAPLSAYLRSVGFYSPDTNGRFYPLSDGLGDTFCGDYGCALCMSKSSLNGGADFVESEAAEEAPGEADDGTGGRGEDELEVRDDFADNPVFTVDVTSGSGEVEFSFKIPDNITEWRLSAVASANLTSDSIGERYFGSAVTGVIATLPYFINVSYPDTYISGDDVAMSARSYGVNVESDTEVKYTAKLYFGDEVIAETGTEAKGNGFGWINFGKLGVGDYRAVITGKTDDGTDAVEARFTVTESVVTVDVRRELEISEIEKLSPKKYPLTLSFYNETLGEFGRVISFIKNSHVSNRTDSAAAYKIAMKASETLYGVSEAKRTENTENDYGTGLLSVISYGTPSAVLSAKILAVAPDYLTPNRSESVINELKKLASGKEFTDEAELTAALLGLAAEGEPILDVLYYVAGGCEKYSLEAKLYLAAAFAYIGDFSAANEIYSDLRSENAKNYDGGELSFGGKNTEEEIKNTANALLVASRIDRDGAAAMVKFLLTHVSDAEYYGLELASYVRFYMPTEVSDTKFTYKLGDKVEEITLGAGDVYTLRLTRSGFEAFDVIEFDEGIKVRAAYKGAPEDVIENGEEMSGFEIKRDIEPYEGHRGFYRVTLYFEGVSNRNYEYFSITDTIPTGARFVMMDSRSQGEISVTNGKHGSAYIYNTSGQNMRGGISIYTPDENKLWNWNSTCGEYTFSGSVSYIVRGAVIGEFIAEAPMVRNERTGAFALGSRMAVVIEDNGTKWKTEYIK